MRNRPIGSVIGAVAGLAFVIINAGAVSAPLLWRLVAAIWFVAIMWFVVRHESDVDQESPSRSALRAYGISVAAMVVAIPLGARIITNALDKPNAVLVWVVFVVGLHFLPFAHAFQLPVFTWLSATLVAVSIVGAVPTFASDSATAAAWTGVVAGFVLLLFSAVGPRLNRRTTAQPT